MTDWLDFVAIVDSETMIAPEEVCGSHSAIAVSVCMIINSAMFVVLNKGWSAMVTNVTKESG